MRAKFKLGLFENPYVDSDEAAKWNGHADHRQLAKQTALASMVLLKNADNVLPLNKNRLKKIALIGPDAVEARLGGYSGPGIDKISILAGIKNIVGSSVKLTYEKGCGRESIGFVTVPSKYLFHRESGQKKVGLLGSYYNNITMDGEPDLVRIDPYISFGWTLFSPHPEIINYDWYSARWEGSLIAPESGEISIGIEGNDGYRLYIDDQLIIDNWQKTSFGRNTIPVNFQKGEDYSIRLEFFESAGDARLKLIWDFGVKNSWMDDIEKSVNIAQKSDVAVIVAGIEEGEFQDRAYLNLPGHQEEMIQRVSETGTPVIVVLVGGSAITMRSWIDNADAILDVWYPGEAGGDAVAEVLFGEYNPAGRLPITFPVHESQLPLYYNHKPTGRGDDYLNLTGKPLFPFGFGRSYTTFNYSDLKIEKTIVGSDESTVLSFYLRKYGEIGRR